MLIAASEDGLLASVDEESLCLWLSLPKLRVLRAKLQRLMQELRTATDFTLWAMEVKTWFLWKAMSTIMVQECHLWLSLVERRDTDKVRFLDAPVSQAGLCSDTV